MQRPSNAGLAGRITSQRLLYARSPDEPLTLRARDHKNALFAHCLAGHVRFELRNVVANYPFEKSRRFGGVQPNSGR
jgi:hypothetical protein